MNSATVLASVVIDELVGGGVRDAVLCPGSRNAPLSFALHAADAAGRLRLHVRIDERGAGFLALGLAARSGRVVPVACTSGTAAANLHPAVLEAHHAGVPLLLLTADRPAELRDTGANQTVDQAGLYGGAVRWRQTLAAPGANAPWRATVCRALAAARGLLTGDAGPVHLNIAMRPPLVPDVNPGIDPGINPGIDPGIDADAATADFAGRPAGRPWTDVWPAAEQRAAGAIEPDEGHGSGPVRLELSARTLVVAGHGRPAVPRWLAGLPRVAEPGSWLWGGSLAAGPWLLGAAARTTAGAGSIDTGVGVADELRPDQVIVVGRPTLHRSVQNLLADPAVRVTVLTDRPQWTDVAGTADTVLRGVPAEASGPGQDRAWVAALRRADAAAGRAVRAVLDDTPWPTGLAVARDLVAALPERALLVLGSSNPIRDVALAATPRADLTVHANRGVAGIDGTVSTAVGAALAHSVYAAARGVPSAHGGRGYALLGDLTFLHDVTGLMIGRRDPRPNLTIVVLNDDGGGIFALLEQGAPEHAAAFERVFATPHGVDLAALCAATGVGHTATSTASELTGALRTPSTGLDVVEIRTDRTALRQLHSRIRTAVATAVRGHAF